MINWSKIPFFKPIEFDDPAYPGSGEQVDAQLVCKLVSLRKLAGWPIVTHWRIGGVLDVDGAYGHATESFHLLRQGAKALDFHFVTDAPLKVQLYYVLTCGFGGVGVYYDWFMKGFHVDVRPIELTAVWKHLSTGYVYI